ncbi:MAG TPA: hypothetical protein VN035_13080 [Microbacterium sp.]|nr:hypothetical protein [Microbacterium sp.]
MNPVQPLARPRTALASTARAVPFRSLVRAELHRTRQTRSTLVLVAVVVGIALGLLVLRTILGRTAGIPLGPEAVTLGTDLVGFAVLLAAAVSTARDHQTGSIDLMRTLTPARARHFAASATGIGVFALAAVGAVIVADIATVLAFDLADVDAGLADPIARALVVTVLLAWAGVGIGASTRSTAAATFTAIMLFWLLPLGFLTAGLAGAAWALPVSDAVLGLLVADAIAPGPAHWVEVGGIALWAVALVGLGVLRDTKGT